MKLDDIYEYMREKTPQKEKSLLNLLQRLQHRS